MSLSDDFAKICLRVKHAESYPAFEMPPVPGLPPSTPHQVRDAFENSVVDEEAMRAKARRFGDLAQNRADDNEDTAGSAFAKRLLPVPHTVGEAAWRLPVAGVGAVAGHGFGENIGRRFSVPSAESIHEVLNREGGPISDRIADELTAGGASAPLDAAQHMGVSPEFLQTHARQEVSKFNASQAQVNTLKQSLVKHDSMTEAMKQQLQTLMNNPGADIKTTEKAIEGLNKKLQAAEIQRAGIAGPLQALEKELASAAPAVAAHRVIDVAKPEKRLASLVSPAQGQVGQKAERLLTELRGMDPVDTRKVLGAVKPLAALHPRHAQITQMMGEGGLDRNKLVRLINSIKPTPPGPWAGRAGAAAGALGAGALTGLPLAIRAARLNATGGEAAHRAREQMRTSVEGAEKEQFKRENMLRALEGTEQLPNKEFRHARNTSRKNWKESIKGYRKGAKAGEKNERRTGSPVATEKKDDETAPAEKRSSQLQRIHNKLAGIEDFQPTGAMSDVPMAALSAMQSAGQLAPGIKSPLKYPMGAVKSLAMGAAPLMPAAVNKAVSSGVNTLESGVGAVDKTFQRSLRAGRQMAGSKAQQLAAMAKKFLFRT